MRALTFPLFSKEFSDNKKTQKMKANTLISSNIATTTLARAYDCMFVEQKDEKVYYILRYNKSKSRACEGYKMKVPTKLRKLETEILALKGRKREKAMKTYRRILFSLEDEPIYFVRY